VELSVGLRRGYMRSGKAIRRNYLFLLICVVTYCENVSAMHSGRPDYDCVDIARACTCAGSGCCCCAVCLPVLTDAPCDGLHRLYSAGCCAGMGTAACACACGALYYHDLMGPPKDRSLLFVLSRFLCALFRRPADVS